MAKKDDEEAARAQARDSFIPGNPPDPADVAPQAEKVADRLEQEARDRSGGTVVPNVPEVGNLPAPAGGGQPAGEARPSVDFPTYAAPEMAGDVVGVAATALRPDAHPKTERLLAAEQRIEWYLQHQPEGPLVPAARLQDAVAALRTARYDAKADHEGPLQTAETLIDRHGIPELPEPAKAGR